MMNALTQQVKLTEGHRNIFRFGYEMQQQGLSHKSAARIAREAGVPLEVVWGVCQVQGRGPCPESMDLVHFINLTGALGDI